jgi:hypothetical protein
VAKFVGQVLSGRPRAASLEPGSLAAFLAERGLVLASNLLPDDFAGRYLRGSDGRVRRPYGCCALAHARVATISASSEGTAWTTE